MGLVTLLLSGLLGDWAWILFPAGFLAMWPLLVMMPLRHRYVNEQPLELPSESGGATRLHGQRKRRFLRKLALIAAAFFVGEAMFRMYGGGLWDWRVPLGVVTRPSH